MCCWNHLLSSWQSSQGALRTITTLTNEQVGLTCGAAGSRCVLCAVGFFSSEAGYGTMLVAFGTYIRQFSTSFDTCIIIVIIVIMLVHCTHQ